MLDWAYCWLLGEGGKLVCRLGEDTEFVYSRLPLEMRYPKLADFYLEVLERLQHARDNVKAVFSGSCWRTREPSSLRQR